MRELFHSRLLVHGGQGRHGRRLHLHDHGGRGSPVRLAHDQKYVEVSALEPPLVLLRACHYSYAIDTLLGSYK